MQETRLDHLFMPLTISSISELLRFTSVSFRNYKALRQYSVSLRGFNVLVGPNNSGKSTILGAFRILSEGIRKALARNAELINLRGEETWGYRVPLDDLPYRRGVK